MNNKPGKKRPPLDFGEGRAKSIGAAIVKHGDECYNEGIEDAARVLDNNINVMKFLSAEIRRRKVKVAHP